MGKKVKTEGQKAFQKERNRLLQAIKRGEKEGYIFPDDIIPKAPKRVTKKAIEKIKAIKPKDLYKVGVWVDENTGEIIPAVQKREQIKKQGIEKAKETRKKGISNKKYNIKGKIKGKAKTPKETETEEPIKPEEKYPTITVIDRIKERIEAMQPPQVFQKGTKGYIEYPIEVRKNYLIEILEDSRTYYGEESYEDYLKSKLEEIIEEIDNLQYKASSTEQIDASFAKLGRLLNAGALSPTQAENLSTMAELYSE